MAVEAAVDPGSLPVSALKGAGPRSLERLARLDLHTVQDLCFHFPLRYEDRTRLVPLGQLRPGTWVLVAGEIASSQVQFGRRRSLLCRISDGTGTLGLRFFHFGAAQRSRLADGVRVRCFGEVRAGRLGLEMAHPEVTVVQDEEPLQPAPSLTPVYPTTEGLNQATLRKLVDQALALVQSDQPVPDWLAGLLPEPFPGLAAALMLVHRPPAGADLRTLQQGSHPARQRLALEELLAHHLSLRRARDASRRYRAPVLADDGMQERLRQALPFQLTAAQQAVLAQINEDMGRPLPMQRLLQGDVGCGKTLVAVASACRAVAAGYQVAVMAPTEILGGQLQRHFREYLEPLGITVDWLAGTVTGRERRDILERIASGATQVAVGTHALFQEAVSFRRLGLVIIDEQHRFGVGQRLALREKGEAGENAPHQLIMTATPIPRTLAMTFYADLDVSVIDELPPGRQPIQTVVVSERRRGQVVERIRAACAEGRQVYWVCPLIESSEVLECQAAQDTVEHLSGELPGIEVGLVHGRLPAAEKHREMDRFRSGEIQLLVATTVIEVGVDVPNASLMVIENAERLGLAQLHQLRGRVGRGSVASVCVLMYKPALSRLGRARLEAMRESSDGFFIAQKDLELRGPGEVLGTRQSGALRLRVADLARDRGLLPQVEALGRTLRDRHPERVDPLLRRWLPSADRYGRV